MLKEKLLTVRDAAVYLGISEKAVIDLSETGLIPAYKVGGVYIRFKEDQLKNVKLKSEVLLKVQQSGLEKHFSIGYKSIKERIVDFFYYNDFYFLFLIICLLLVYVVFNT
jgi:excisionase family DNA binding protein